MMSDDFVKANSEYCAAMKEVVRAFLELANELRRIRQGEQWRLYNALCGIDRSLN